nr:NaeI family type II restriction endonuclease [Sphingomonas sp. Y57]
MTDEPLVSTKDRPGEYDAFETAKPGEPIFTLQGGDPLAPPTILHWADLARGVARQETKQERADALFKKAANAELVAWAMAEYQRGDDYEAQQQARAADEAAMTVEANVVLARGVDRLHNAIAEALELADNPAMDRFVKERGRLRSAAEMLRGVARVIEPRRHMREQSA